VANCHLNFGEKAGKKDGNMCREEFIATFQATRKCSSGLGNTEYVS
jgi:hypothetical protein